MCRNTASPDSLGSAEKYGVSWFWFDVGADEEPTLGSWLVPFGSKKRVGPSLGWPRRNYNGVTPNFLCQERLRLWLFWRPFVRHFSSWASLQRLRAADSNDLPGPALLPMTKFEGPSECPCYTVPDQCNVGRLTSEVGLSTWPDRLAEWNDLSWWSRSDNVLGDSAVESAMATKAKPWRRLRLRS